MFRSGRMLAGAFVLAAALVVLSGCGGGQGSGGGTGGSKEPIKVGVVVSVTGNTSSLGEPEQNSIKLFQDKFSEAGGHEIQYIVRDSASSSTKALTAVKDLIQEQDVAAVVCCTTSPNSLAIQQAVKQSKVPNISLAASDSIVEPASEKKMFFKTAPNDGVMTNELAGRMAEQGIKKVGFIGFDDAFGEGGLEAFKASAEKEGIELSGQESFNRTATDVTAQLTKLQSTDPDAYLVWATPPGADVVAKGVQQLGIDTPVYQSHGVLNQKFLKLGGEAVEGQRMPAEKLFVAESLESSDPQKDTLKQFRDAYTKEYGENSLNAFAGHAYDAMHIIQAAAKRTVESGTEPSETSDFRKELRNQIEKTQDYAGITGVFNYSPQDHAGLTSDSMVMLQVEDNDWKLISK